MTAASDVDAHPYFGASNGCWAAYGKVLEREYSDARFFANHRQTVDAYALQHPGNDDPRAIQSVNIHLIALCLLYEHNCQPVKISKIMNSIVKKNKGRFSYLVAPNNLGRITVTDILPLTELEEHLLGVDKWAKQMWELWQDHHDVPRNYINAELTS